MSDEKVVSRYLPWIDYVSMGKNLMGVLTKRQQPYILWGTPGGHHAGERIYGFFANKGDAELALKEQCVKRARIRWERRPL